MLILDQKLSHSTSSLNREILSISFLHTTQRFPATASRHFNHIAILILANITIDPE